MSGYENDQSSFCTKCCSWCCCIHMLCLQAAGKKRRFPGVEYELVPSPEEGMIFHQMSTPEVKKDFTLPQGKSEYAIPLQLSDSGGERGQFGFHRRPVTKQPRRERSFSAPDIPAIYIPGQPSIQRSVTLPRGRSSDYSRSSPPSPTPLSSSLSSLTESVTSSMMTAPHPTPYDLEESGMWKPTLSSIVDEEEPVEEKGGETGTKSRIPTVAPEIEFSLYYDIQCRTLMVYLQCANHLPFRGKTLTLSPIVILYLLPNREDILHSRMIENSTNPCFNQSLEFKGLLPDEIRRQTLIFRIYSHKTKGELLGGLAVSLAEADLFGIMCRKQIDTDMEKLKMVTRGDMLLSLTYNPGAKRLQGFLLKATNLQKQDIVGLADPYVKIWLLRKGRRDQKWKSKTKRNTLIPIFNEAFQFDLSDMDMKEVALEVLMMDYDRFSRNDVVGVIYIGESVPHNTGKQHWEQIMAQPNTSISNWHTILPITAQTERTTRKKKVSTTIQSSYYKDDENH